MAALVETPRRQGRYSCAACDGVGFVDERRHRELTETPGPLFVSASQRSPARRAETPSHVFTVTNKNRKRERDRKQRLEGDKAPSRRPKRPKKCPPTVADSEDESGKDDEGGEASNDDGGDEPRVNSEPGCAEVVSTLQEAVSPATQQRLSTTPSPSPAADVALAHSGVTDAEAAGSDRAGAAAMLKLGLGKGSQISPAAFDAILNAAFAVAGPEAMEDILGLCRKWRDGLVYHTPKDIDSKMAALRAEWEGRLPDNDQKGAIIDVHVAAYWASAEEADDFTRSIVRRGRFAEFWEAFQVLLHPCVRPNPGWKKKFGEVKRLRLAEAHPGLDPQGKEYGRKARQLERQLQYGERWGRLRRDFGPGIFALLPSAVVTNRWVEQEMSATQFDAWLRILRRYNPPKQAIVDRVWWLVNEALSGRQPPERLRLEDAPLSELSRGCRDLGVLLPLTGVQGGDEDESFDRDGAFLEGVDVT
ncbi:hypothetical protein Q7P37_003052 [Cladosporium fusiforme]